MLYLSLRLVHLVFMGTWFGSNLLSIRDVKTSFAAGPAHLPGLRDRMMRSGRLATISGGLTLLSGFGLIFMLGGFSSVPRAIHIGLATGIACSIVGAAGVGRTWMLIEKKLDAGAEPSTLEPLLKRLTMLSGIFQLLWLVSLVLMVFRAVAG